MMLMMMLMVGYTMRWLYERRERESVEEGMVAWMKGDRWTEGVYNY